LLAEAVEELKASSSNLSLGERGIEPVLSLSKDEAGVRKSVIVGEAKQSPTISLPLDAHIPEEYVPNLNTRLSLYHRLAKVKYVEEVDDVAQELQDRFGTLPESVENLLYIVKIKVLAVWAEVNSISTQGRQIVIKPRTDSSPLKVRGAGGVMKSLGDARNPLYPPYPKGEIEKKKARISEKEEGVSRISPLKMRGERPGRRANSLAGGGVMSEYTDAAVKISATQIKLDARLLGDRWKVLLEELLSSNCA
jgi:hypothetical protein